MARRTDSYGLFAQQLGRLLRAIYAPGTDMSTVEGRLWGIQHGPKPRGILLDHVGNYISHVIRMGLPEDPKPWTLNARERRSSNASDGIPLTPCEECGRPYESFRVCCPYCGFRPTPAERSKPELVAGDLELLDREMLKKLSEEINRIDGEPLVPGHLRGKPAETALVRRHGERQQAQEALRDTIAAWGGYRRHEGLSDRESQKKFYYQFGVDVMTAQTLNAKDATDLKQRIEGGMTSPPNW